MLRFLLKIWPALLPIAIYSLWLWAKKKSKSIDATYQELDKDGKPKQGDFSLQNRKFIVVLYLSLLIAILCFLFFAIRVPNIEEGTYVPAHMKNGKVIPAEIVR